MRSPVTSDEDISPCLCSSEEHGSWGSTHMSMCSIVCLCVCVGVSVTGVFVCWFICVYICFCVSETVKLLVRTFFDYCELYAVEAMCVCVCVCVRAPGGHVCVCEHLVGMCV